MKKLISSFILALLLTIITACGGGDTYTTTTLPPAAPTPAVNAPTIEPPALPRTIFIYDSAAETIGTSDGTYYFDLDTGKSANARDGFISIGDILHGIDDTGTSIITQRLPVTPDKIAINGSDIWCFETYFDAMSGKTYTIIWLNNSQYGAWTDNRYEVAEAIVTDSDDIIVLDTGGKFRNVLDSTMVVNYAGHDGLLIYGVDAANHRANIREFNSDIRVAFSTNYFFGAKQWIKADGIYYSWNGYAWDGTTLAELSNKLVDFVLPWFSDRPVLVSVGSRIEHGESVMYWIECNTGWLYRHTPSIDALEQIIQLYMGSGDRSDGLTVRDSIKPVLAGVTADNLFFTWGGTVWKYDFTDALVSSFATGVEIWEM